jgi:hypothetical protein
MKLRHKHEGWPLKKWACEFGLGKSQKCHPWQFWRTECDISQVHASTKHIWQKLKVVVIQFSLYQASFYKPYKMVSLESINSY